MSEFLSQPWPWYVAGPIIGLFLPILLLIGNKQFGVSSNLRHMCAAVLPRDCEYFRYDWKSAGAWNLAFILGIAGGGVLAGQIFAPPDVAISAATRDSLGALGIVDFSGMAPSQIFRWESLLSLRGVIATVGGGFLVGFGAAYAGGCTSGHGIAGLADRQLPSLIAVAGFFAGGIISTYLLLPLLLVGAR